MRDERFGPSEGFGKASELSGVAAGRSCTSKRWVLTVTHYWGKPKFEKECRERQRHFTSRSGQSHQRGA